MRYFFFCILLLTFIALFHTSSPVSATDSVLKNDTAGVYYGNVYGTLYSIPPEIDVQDIQIFVTDHPVNHVSEDYPSAVLSNIGWITVPGPETSVCSAVIDSDGSYIVNNIPVHTYGSCYNVIIRAKGTGPVIIDSALILPGAVMALQIDVQIDPAETAHIVAMGHTSRKVVTNSFRHERFPSSDAVSMPDIRDSIVSSDSEDALTLRIYATREGLVGGTTANGHVIRERDHFVALPSTRVLCSKGGYEYQVRLEHNGYTETAPVWDIGPWNIHDNYWEPEEDRLIYQYLKDGGQHGGLGRGVPESQAAYQDDFNSGRDEFSRRVVNPAGIDLADGTFWDGLNLSDNAWITVKYLWLEGDGDDSASCFIETAAENQLSN